MSLVGTRPPTVDEWDKYELHHRARLATKPGLTGMWQVSGRSNITDLKNKLPCLLTIISGFINVVVMYFMLKYTNIGPSIVVATTTIIMLCMNLFFNPIYGAHCLKISPRFFYKIIVRHIFSAFIMVVVFIGIEKIIKPGNWGSI